MKTTLVIDGSFVNKQTTGVQRFCWEVLKELAMLQEFDIILAIEKDADISSIHIDDIKIIKIGKLRGKLWQLFSLGRFCKKNNYQLLCMSNFYPLFYKSHLVLHDVRFLEKHTGNKKILNFVYRTLIGLRIKKQLTIFTVSEFSKDRILHYYKKIPSNNIVVTAGCGNEHYHKIEAEPFLIDEPFYLSVGTNMPHKNFKYTIELAKNNPNKNFLVVGNPLGNKPKQIISSNLIFTGYISEKQLKYLYSKCTAFILPSLYEGIGLPPLEALTCGCKYLALSDIAAFREVYGEVATFFDPLDYNKTIDLDKMLDIKEADIAKVLAKHTWKIAAHQIKDRILNTIK